MKVLLVQINLCEACLNGIGQQCHTPGCALFLKRCPDIPVMRELYDVIDEISSEELEKQLDSIGAEL